MDINSFLEQYSDDGYHDFSEFSWHDKTIFCEKNKMIWRVTNNGGYRLVKSFYCGHDKVGPNGERPCTVCAPIKDRARKKEIEGKVRDAFNGNQFLYLAETKNDKESTRLLGRMKKKKVRYLSIPTGKDTRLFLMDRFDKITSSEATDIWTATTLFLANKGNTEHGRLSGNFDGDVASPDDAVITYTRPERLSTTPEVDVFLMNNIETEAILTMGVDEITEDNAAELINMKLALKLEILNECGYSASYHGEKEATIRVSQLKDIWFAAKISVISTVSLSQFPSMIADEIKRVEREGLQRLRRENRDYLKSHGDKSDDTDPFRDMGIWK